MIRRGKSRWLIVPTPKSATSRFQTSRHLCSRLHRLCIARNRVLLTDSGPMDKLKETVEDEIYSDLLRIVVMGFIWIANAACCQLTRIQHVASLLTESFFMEKNEFEPYSPSLDVVRYSNPHIIQGSRGVAAQSDLCCDEAKGRCLHQSHCRWLGEESRTLQPLREHSKKSYVCLGLKEATKSGAAGELETILNASKGHGLDTDKMSPSIHTGARSGVGKLYKDDTVEKEFGFVPEYFVCIGRGGQNQMKDYYSTTKRKQSIKFYDAVGEELKDFIGVKKKVTDAVAMMARSHYHSIFGNATVTPTATDMILE